MHSLTDFTYTMIGDKELKSPGIAPRAMEAIYKLMEEQKWDLLLGRSQPDFIETGLPGPLTSKKLVLEKLIHAGVARGFF